MIISIESLLYEHLLLHQTSSYRRDQDELPPIGGFSLLETLVFAGLTPSDPRFVREHWLAQAIIRCALSARHTPDVTLRAYILSNP